MSYYYGMRVRPFDIGCQPSEGLVACVSDKVVVKGYWDILEYGRKLTDDECEHYSLDFIRADAEEKWLCDRCGYTGEECPYPQEAHCELFVPVEKIK